MRKLLVALGATFVVLLGTGLYQAFEYSPDPPGGTPIDHALVYDTTEVVHRVGAWVFVGFAIAVVVAGVRRARGTARSTFITVVVLGVLALATMAAMITGGDLRWDQLALSVVTLGDVKGVVGIDGVKFVLIDGAAEAWSEFSSRVFLHLVLFPVGIVICGGVLWYLAVRDDRRRTTPASSPEDPDGNHDDTGSDDDLVEAPT